MTEDFKKRYIAARRKLIESDFKGLNPRQLEAVTATEGPLLLLAGAGSGKTTVLISRIVNILRFGRASDSDEVPENASEEDVGLLEAGPSPEARAIAALDPAEPWRVMAITFTNKAADELKERLQRELGAAAGDVWAMTFHSACVRILRRDADRLGFGRNFTIYDASDSQSVMKRIIREMNLDEKLFQYKSVLGEIGRAKDDFISPEEYAARSAGSGDVRRSKYAQLYTEYARRLRSAGAVDFDDLIYFTVKLLKENADVLSYWQNRFRYILIDEYQDTDKLQYMLAEALAGKRRNICVVGDDDQSIYKFRGATIENILSFEDSFRNARVIRLEQNYRSTGHILKAANAVIKNNVGRKGKTLWTDKGDGDLLTLHVAENEREEARYVADRMLEIFGAGEKWKSCAVLYRMNAQSNQLEYAFKRAGIPYRVFGGMRFFDRAEVKDVLAYLCVARNPSDDERLLRIINVPARGVGDTTVETVRRLANERGVPIMDILRSADEYADLSRAGGKLMGFAAVMEELHEAAEFSRADEVFDLLLEKTGYVRVLEEKGGDEELARIENVEELKTNILSYIAENEDGLLAGFLDEVALYADIDNYDRDADSAVMMTMHSAKGLEFDTVFIVGAEEGIFPGLRAIGEPDEMEEERRLCYVAVTRARKKLYICCASRRTLFGKTLSNRVSRFVDEIPEDDIEKPKRRTEWTFGDESDGGSARLKPGQMPAGAPRVRPVITPETVRAPAPDYREGDMVDHSAFGRGMIVTMTPMGGDHLVEVAFDRVGTKRLMLRAASLHMKKIK